jgi:dTDP-4-dehydrorhamnose reductase
VSRHLVIGGSGFLGQALLRALGGRGIGTFARNGFQGGIAFDATAQRLADIASDLPDDLSHVFLLHGIINPDRCFREPEITRAANVSGMMALIEEIFARGLVPVYMSTDYVFDGTRGMRTEDEPLSPTTAYGRQKAEVEQWLGGQDRPCLISRASKIVSGAPDTHSVLGPLAEDFAAGRTVRWADDQIFSPGHVDDVAAAMIALADGGHTGAFNVAGPTPFSRYALARLLADRVIEIAPETPVALSSCKLAEVPFAEPRPLDTSLDTRKLAAATGIEFRSMEALCAEVAAKRFG